MKPTALLLAALLTLSAVNGDPVEYQTSDSINDQINTPPHRGAEQEYYYDSTTQDEIADSEQLLDIQEQEWDGPLNPGDDANWAVEGAEEPAEIKWTTWEERNPSWPTWIHYYGDNCPPCIQMEQDFKEQDVITQSQSWNCIKVKLADGSPVPRDVFVSPDGKTRRNMVVGRPRTTQLLEDRLYDNWHYVMGLKDLPARPQPRRSRGLLRRFFR